MTQIPRQKTTVDATAAPTPSSLPERMAAPVANMESSQAGPISSSALLHSKGRLRIHFEDVTHPAVTAFAVHLPLGTILQTAVINVEKCLFTPPSSDNDQSNAHRPMPHPNPRWKPQEVRVVTLLLRDIDGVAYTSGTELDEAHKEINLSLKYVNDIKRKNTSHTNTSSSASSSNTKYNTHTSTAAAAASASPIPQRSNQYASPSTSISASSVHFDSKSFVHEMSGVITHEMVHCFQHDASGSCPGGLVEGIADYVRMKSGLAALHWNKFPANKDTRGEKWDEGYQKTAWFLEWVEDQIGGQGCIGALNDKMRSERWDDGKVWEKVMNGVTVDECWEAYKNAWEGMQED